MIEAQLAVDLFETEVNGVVVKLSLRDTSGRNSSRQARNFTLGIAPTATSLARSVWVSCAGKTKSGIVSKCVITVSVRQSVAVSGGLWMGRC